MYAPGVENMLENTRRRLWPFGLDMRNGHPGPITLPTMPSAANPEASLARQLCTPSCHHLRQSLRHEVQHCLFSDLQ